MEKYYCSVVECLGKNVSTHCGYCKRPSVFKESLGLEGHFVGCDCFNQLLDRGWSRSGNYIYKPINKSSCCPQYTIRLDVHKFKLSRSQKRVLRQMNEFLVHGRKPSHKMNENGKACGTKNNSMREHPLPPERTKEDANHSVVSNKKRNIRLERCFENMRKAGIDIEEAKRFNAAKEEAKPRTVESYVLPYENSHAHKLEVRLVDLNSNEMYEKTRESFELYRKYQMRVHNETDVTFGGYHYFLLKTPLFDDDDDLPESYKDDGITFGTYHEHYLLDGKLIAVGVLDIMPRGVSSNYMFYDPDYSFLNLGTYTALREIELTIQMNRTRPALHYYYLGFYIHSCPKMRYKSQFRPSDLLCDTTYTWVSFEKCKGLLDKNECVPAFAPDAQPAVENPVDYVVCIYNRRLMRYKTLLEEPTFTEKETFMEEYARLMGPLAQKVYLYRT